MPEVSTKGREESSQRNGVIVGSNIPKEMYETKEAEYGQCIL
jgi:hypothetical protein